MLGWRIASKSEVIRATCCSQVAEGVGGGLGLGWASVFKLRLRQHDAREPSAAPHHPSSPHLFAGGRLDPHSVLFRLSGILRLRCCGYFHSCWPCIRWVSFLFGANKVRGGWQCASSI